MAAWLPGALGPPGSGACMFPDRPGTSVLVLRLSSPVAITVGQLGCFEFPAGWYAYAGSAQGPGGLGARLSRHVRSPKTLHWHIDYLRTHAAPVEIWHVGGGGKRECAWANALSRLPAASLPVPRFGSSDCRCPTHLVHFAAPPGAAVFADLVGERVSVVTLPCGSIAASG